MSKKMSFLAVLALLVITATPNVLLADNGPEHRASQSRPVKLGTSGGNINDIASYCCSGTLGALVDDGINQYILSNNHVLAMSNHGTIGGAINQPGMIDQNCGQAGVVASLSDFVQIRFKKGRSIPLNTADAAIALVIDGAVDPNGRILDIGQPSSETLIAELDQLVQKSGRTSGHTKGIVTAIGVTVDVGYSRECGGAANQTARFVDQIIIKGTTELPDGNIEPFSTGGDSGSLILEDVVASPRAVGLLFAGSSTLTVANPIDAVLNAFGVVMAGAAVAVPEPEPEPEPEPDPTPTLIGSITGTITNSSTEAPVAGADVSTDTGQTDVTAADGTYLLSDVPVGDRQVIASASGLRDQAKTVTVNEGATVTSDFALRAQKGGGGRGKPKAGAIRSALKAKNRHVKSLLAIEGVIGAGVGLSDQGQPVVQVYLSKDSNKVKKQIPSKVDDVPVAIVITGTFKAF